jgi:hypothetical protein
MDLSEKYITICCYKQLFCPNVTDDEDKDLELQNRIRSLNWISTEHMSCSIDEFSQEVRDLLYQAINGKQHYTRPKKNLLKKIILKKEPESP